VGNPQITYNNSAAIGHSDPFNLLYVDGWYGIGTPQIDTVYTSSPSSALCWTQRSSPSGTSQFEGIFQSLVPLEVGKPYLFSFKLRHQSGGTQVDLVKAYLTNSAFSLISSGPPISGPIQPVLFVPNVNHGNFVQYTTCSFIPTQSWQQLVVHPEQQVFGPTQWAGIDDIVFIPNFGFAGNDTILCTAGLQLKLGTGACNGQYGATYEWFTASNPTTAFSTSAQPVIVVNQTEEYIVKRTIFGCDTYDTVLVEVKNLIPPDLGPDQIFCDSMQYTLHTPFNDSTWYFWEPMNQINYEGNTMVIWHSGTYKVTISKDGCEMSDSVHITMLLEIEVIPDTVRTCGTDSVTFCATPGMASYYWSNGDTNRCITVYTQGVYTVEVTDSNGCKAMSYAVLYRGTPFTVSLGEDRYGCVDVCETLSPTIIGSSTVSNFTYLWSTSATTPTICVNSTGTYWVCVSDTLGCTACDSIFVRIRQKTKPTAANIGPLCLYDAPYTLSGHATPIFGFYEGRGVANLNGTYKFIPRAAGPGQHTITYTYTNDSGCTDTVNFTITVLEGPYAELESVHTCVTQNMVQIPLHTQSQIPGTWSINAPNGEFDPSTAGPGIHTVSYTITDTITGCTYTAEAKVYVGQNYSASYTWTPPNGWQCEGKVVMHEATDGHRWIWENSITQEIITTARIAGLQSNGSYNLYVMDSIGNCPPAMVGIYVSFGNCCEVNDPFLIQQIEEHFDLVTSDGNAINEYYKPKHSPMIIMDKVWYFDKPVIVPRGTVLKFINCDFLMKSCSRIIVENGAILDVENSEIGYCGWQGIEVGGWYDCCQTVNSQNCDLSNGCLSSSELYIDNSKIHYADIAVTAGYKEDYTLVDCSSATIQQDLSGGAMVELKNSIFSRNYIDVLFREYDNQQMHFDLDVCRHKDPGHALNDSKIENCVFTLPAVQQYCNSIKQELAGRISGVGGRCHIVDLAETSIHYQPLFYDDG
jgi:hypothetical protein